MRRSTAMLLALLFVTAALAKAQTTQPKSTNSTEQELIELTRQWDDALVKGKLDIVSRMLSDEYTFSGTPKTQYLASLASPDAEYKSYERSDITSRIYGDTVLVFGRTSVSGKYPGVDWFSSTFNFMDVWVKQRGLWKCVATMHDQIKGETSKPRIHFGPDVKANLVVVFNLGTTDKQVEDFWRTVLQVSGARGYRFRDGIQSCLKVPLIEGHQALAIQFLEDAPHAQKDEIKRGIKASDLVYKLFDEIAPTEIKLR